MIMATSAGAAGAFAAAYHHHRSGAHIPIWLMAVCIAIIFIAGIIYITYCPRKPKKK